MVGLTRLDTEVHEPDAPTILNLFAKADGQEMPAGLTEWDEAIAQSVVDEVSGLGK
jgi:ethanolamine utilization protein EutQ (cupin superfamily)